METIINEKHIVCYSNFKYEHCPELRSYLDSEDFSELGNRLKEKTIIVLGGDGTMLNAIKEHYDKSLPFLGINFGNKGFILNLKDYINSESVFKKVSYPLTQVEIECKGKKYKDIFVNEVNIASVHGRMIDLSISLNNKLNLGVKGDGLIVSSAIGSTGYNSSLGGPILPHNINALVITPKAPWNPRGMHPIIVQESDVIYVKNSGRYCDGEVFLDGIKLASVNDCSTIKIAKSKFNFELLIEEKYKDIWDNKVLLEQGFE